MKGVLKNILLLILLSCYPKNADSSRSQKDECVLGSEKANVDLNQNLLRMYFFGYPDSRLNAYIKILSSEYQVQVKGGGDIITKEGECYNMIMEKKIKEKYGENIFDKIDKKVDSLISNGYGDKAVEYRGGTNQLNEYLACNLNFFNEKEDSNNPSVFVELLIDTTGKVKSSKIIKGFSKNYNDEALRVSKLLSNWNSAIENGKKIESQITIRISFNPALKNKRNCK